MKTQDVVVESAKGPQDVGVLDLPLPPGWDLLPRHADVIRGVLAGKSVRDAVVSAGYKTSQISRTLNMIVDNRRLRPALAYALAKAGVVDQLKAETLAAALQANREYQTNIGVIAGGPDHGTRLKALMIALKLDGDLGGVQVEGSETFESHVQAAQIAGYSEE